MSKYNRLQPVEALGAVDARPLVNDQIMPPEVDASDMRWAMRVVYEHMHKVRTASREDLLRALDVMEIAYKNGNWVEYVP